MQFVDEIMIEVRAGNGGDGSAAMRREKYRPLGGPAGGDGGKGGDVILEADERLTTLLDLRYKRLLQGERGEHGRGRDQYGKGGKDMAVRVPVGTQVFDADSGELVADLSEPGQREIVAAGGRGGRGNIHFVTSTERAPTRAEPGEAGGQRNLRMELKLLADVGLVGFPNAGKSTLIKTISRAQPKVADYPFTTLVPNLGVVSRGMDRNFVVADIPGIIEGAADGAGLGHRFLKHVERTRVLLYLVTWDPDPERGLLSDFETLQKELQRFDPALAERPMVVSVSKQDLPEAVEALDEFRAAMAGRDITVHPFSSATTEGLQPLLDAVEQILSEHPVPPPPRRHPLVTAADRPHPEANGEAIGEEDIDGKGAGEGG